MKVEVQNRLIESAVEVFAQKGFRDAKIAEIVKGAGANIAAVNYHFGSKEKLFVAVLRRAFKAADEAYPGKGDLAEEATAKERVAAIARAILLRSLDKGPAGNFNRIMSRTMHNPESPIQLVVGEVQSLELSYLEGNLREFLGCSDDAVIAWAVSIFISLSIIFSQRPGGPDGILPVEVEQEQIDRFIEIQIEAIFASLAVLPSQFGSHQSQQNL